MQVTFRFYNGHEEIKIGESFETIVKEMCEAYNVGIDDPQYIVSNVDDLVKQGTYIEIMR